MVDGDWPDACDVVVAGPGTVAGAGPVAGPVAGAGTVAVWCCLKRAFLSWAC